MECIEIKTENCIIKGCNNPRFRDKFLCEKHWKERRMKRNYKEDW